MVKYHGIPHHLFLLVPNSTIKSKFFDVTGGILAIGSSQRLLERFLHEAMTMTICLAGASQQSNQCPRYLLSEQLLASQLNLVGSTCFDQTMQNCRCTCKLTGSICTGFIACRQAYFSIHQFLSVQSFHAHRLVGTNATIHGSSQRLFLTDKKRKM